MLQKNLTFSTIPFSKKYLLTFVFIQVIIIIDLANLILQTYSAEINDSTKF